MPQRLTPRQEKFARTYATMAVTRGVTPNLTQAAKDAGYSERSAHVEGSRTLANDRVKARVDELMQTGVDANEVTPELIIKGLLDEALNAKESGSKVAAWKTLAQVRSMLINVNKDMAADLSDEDLAEDIAKGDKQAYDIILAALKGEPTGGTDGGTDTRDIGDTGEPDDGVGNSLRRHSGAGHSEDGTA